MKISNLILLLFLTGSLITASCKKNDDPSPSDSDINSTVQQGSWRISFYEDKGINETGNYAGYAFIFGSGGVITANSSSGSTSGTWTSGTDNSTLKLTIGFPAVSPLDELNEDWEVLEQNSSLIKLKHVSGGNGGLSYLDFSKI